MKKLILTSEKTSRKFLSPIYDNILIKLCLILMCLGLASNFALCQIDSMIVITNERGDTISYQWPPDPSTYVADEIIIKFRPQALYLEKLCYDRIKESPSGGEENLDSINKQKSEIMSQQFPIDTLIADISLREVLKSFGGIYLKRITSANPCEDSISITRNGDTIYCDDYLWMTLKFNNDTSVIRACETLKNFGHLIALAQPNYNINHDAGRTDEMETKMNSYIYPNPTSGNFTIAFVLDSPSNVEFQLYNSLGEKIFNSEGELFPAGLNKKEIDTGNLENGIYFCKLVAQSKTQYLKLIVIK